MGQMDYKPNGSTDWGGIILINKNEFCEHIRLCEKAMYSLAFSIVKNNTDAEEVISESIYRAYKNLDSLKYKKFFKTWLLHIVHNTAVELIRKNSKILLTDELIDTADNGNEKEITTKLTLHNAINHLKQPYCTVIVLFYYEDLSISKIAQITNTNPVTVKKQLSRARMMLKELLKEDFKE